MRNISIWARFRGAGIVCKMLFHKMSNLKTAVDVSWAEIGRNHGNVLKMNIWAGFLGAGKLRGKHEEQCVTPKLGWDFSEAKLWEDAKHKYLGLVPGSLKFT